MNNQCVGSEHILAVIQKSRDRHFVPGTFTAAKMQNSLLNLRPNEETNSHSQQNNVLGIALNYGNLSLYLYFAQNFR